jgi:hypothetical protein
VILNWAASARCSRKCGAWRRACVGCIRDRPAWTTC